MRLIKLSREEFGTADELEKYFSETLPNRNPPGLFRITNGRISEDGLLPGETILFSYNNNICFITTAKTGRMSNTYMPDEDNKYPYCFKIDLPPRKASIPLEDLERKLQEMISFKKSYKGSGWTKIPDGELTDQAVEKLFSA